MSANTKTPEQVALDAAVAVELARDYARNLVATTDPADLAPNMLAEYRAHVRKIVQTHAAHTRTALVGAAELVPDARYQGGRSA